MENLFKRLRSHGQVIVIGLCDDLAAPLSILSVILSGIVASCRNVLSHWLRLWLLFLRPIIHGLARATGRVVVLGHSSQEGRLIV